MLSAVDGEESDLGDMPELEALDSDSESGEEDLEALMAHWRGQWEDSGDDGDNEEGSFDDEDTIPDSSICVGRAIRRIMEGWYEHRYRCLQ